MRLRTSVLMRCYHGDYHTDVFDQERLAGRVADGSERILFWGDAAEVRTVAELVRTRAEPEQEVLDGLRLGTHTTLSGAGLYGPGHLEVARTGSTQARVSGASEAIMWDLGRVLGGAGRTPFHTISCVPRNRRSSGRIPGGTAIHRIHTRQVGSAHWGVAPFYIMAGRFMELLDYRELSADSEAVRRGFGEQSAVYLADEESAALVRGLCRLNGFDPRVHVASDGPIAAAEVSDAAPAGGAPGDPHGPRVVFIDLHSLQRGLDDAVAARGEACTVAMCDLEAEGSPEVQATLLARGFRLTYISPPKIVYPAGSDGQAVRIPLRGGFCRPNSEAPPAPPYYLGGGPLDEVEKSLADSYRTLMRVWEREGSNRD
ncbi:hypothetical protein [Streptomyces sp. PU-14G]|uniref:hypothetical protein n=1 Tax=Streptomyces sp. PU-14G TaxID=2800808 RepID=UPI0034DFEBE9